MSEPINLPSRRALLAATGATLLAEPALAAAPFAGARYTVALTSVSPPRFSVSADLPLAGDKLILGDSWPAELPAMADKGWPAVVSGLQVRDGAGQLMTATPRQGGWTLDRPAAGRVRLAYTVDLGLFAAAGWSSPLESVVAEDGALSVIGRALFITAEQPQPAEVAFAMPAGWRAVMPWSNSLGGARYRVPEGAGLVDNMLVFSRTAPAIARAAGFTLQITAMGHWKPLTALVRDSLSRIIAAETRLMGWTKRETYNVVLVPTEDTGGEAYRQSFAYCFAAPTADNRADWANTLAHEIFHYWNYARLKGADYASSQWFQEGFTEYAANLVLLSGKVAPPQAFLDKLGKHIETAAKLTTTLENIGTHKGPPLYSAGALVAFSWDVAIRRHWGGRKNIGDFFRALMTVTGDGAKPYAWEDILAALTATVPGDWQAFYDAHIRGAASLPIGPSLEEAGLTLEGASVVIDPAASPESRAVWRSLQSI